MGMTRGETAYDASWYGMEDTGIAFFRYCESILLEFLESTWKVVTSRQRRTGGKLELMVLVYGIGWYWFVGPWTQKRRRAFIYLFVQENISFELSLFSSIFCYSALGPATVMTYGFDIDEIIPKIEGQFPKLCCSMLLKIRHKMNIANLVFIGVFFFFLS